MTPDQRTPVLDRLDRIIDILERPSDLPADWFKYMNGRQVMYLNCNYGGAMVQVAFEPDETGFTLTLVINGGVRQRLLGHWRWAAPE